MQHATTQWRRRLSASDPGHARLTNTLAVTAAVLVSTGASWLIVRHELADRGFFASAILLTVQLAMTVDDDTPRGRLATSAAALVPMVAAPAAAALLDQWRGIEIAFFIALAGLAIWLRRFGSRSGTLGMVAFFAYFYALVLRPPPSQLPGYLLLMACVTGGVVLVRLLLLHERPGRQLAILLSELRAASAAALTAATGAVPGTDRFRLLKGRLRAVDSVAWAIAGWQSRFPTADVVDCTDRTLRNRTLDARIDVEHAALEVSALVHSRGPGVLTGPLHHALDDLALMLDDAPSSAWKDAADRARRQRTAAADDLPAGLATYLTARSTLAHWALRTIDLNAPYRDDSSGVDVATVSDSSPTAGPPVTPRSAAPTGAAGPSRAFWRTWAPSTRMAVQAMVAAGLATVVGEAIDASRWYWAVMASFMIFVGTTRSSVLTRASRRVIGTGAAVALGIVVAVVLDGPSYWHLLIGLAGVIGAFYLGPLNQIYSAFFLTLLVVSQYGLLGVLDPRLMTLRLEETVAGMAVGVLCAFLVFSTDSKHALAAAVTAYLGALTTLVRGIGAAMTRPGQTRALLASAAALDRAQEKLDAIVGSMSLSFVNGRRSRVTTLTHLMRVASRSAEHAAQSAIHVTDRAPGEQLGGAGANVFEAAVAHVVENAARARAVLVDGAASTADPEDTSVADACAQLRSAAEAAPSHALLLLTRVDWALVSACQIRSKVA
ncbi:FUSC family protein [Gordonia iterans]